MSAGARVLLVDENDDFVDALGAWLEAEIVGLRIVGRAHSMLEAVAQASRHHPDLVVSDVTLPDGSGFEIARRLAAITPGAACLLLTLYEGNEVAAEGRAAGANACIAKTAVTKKLLPAVRALLAARTRTDGQEHTTAEGKHK
jgi:DNA-binding NarL/FixJ family response regulator